MSNTLLLQQLATLAAIGAPAPKPSWTIAQTTIEKLERGNIVESFDSVYAQAHPNAPITVAKDSSGTVQVAVVKRGDSNHYDVITGGNAPAFAVTNKELRMQDGGALLTLDKNAVFIESQGAPLHIDLCGHTDEKNALQLNVCGTDKIHLSYGKNTAATKVSIYNGAQIDLASSLIARPQITTSLNNKNKLESTSVNIANNNSISMFSPQAPVAAKPVQIEGISDADYEKSMQAYTKHQDDFKSAMKKFTINATLYSPVPNQKDVRYSVELFKEGKSVDDMDGALKNGAEIVNKKTAEAVAQGGKGNAINK